MLTAQELLQEGETLLGDYNVEIARWMGGSWVPTVPTLYAVLTQHRLILQPQTRKRYEPAIIPTSYIIRARELQSGIRHGLMIQLKTGHQIGMFIGGDPNHDLIKRLRNALLPQNRTKPNFKIELDLDSIQKMIDYFSDETPGA